MSSAEILLANQLHLIGETKYKEFQIINNFWKQQHAFIKEWESTFKKMNELFTKEAHIIEFWTISDFVFEFLPKKNLRKQKSFFVLEQTAAL